MNKRWERKHWKRHPLGVRKLLMNEHLASSEMHLRAAISKEPSDYALRATLVDLLRRRGRTREALLEWRTTLHKFPGIANPYFQRVLWAMEQRNFAEAAKYLGLCLRYDRGYFRETAHFWRAESLYRLGRFKEARDHLANVSDDYSESYFLDYREWSKSDLIKAIRTEEARHVV